MQKKALAIHDISCVGKCSLTVALPILSAAGIETSILPTAVLSTHTGDFEGYTFRDLTEDITPITNHWKKINLKFDTIFSGYLGSYKQIELVDNIFNDFKKDDTFIMVDPVMGDNGKMYSNLTSDFAYGFKNLCRKADIITPNLTEASLLLNIPYKDFRDDKEFISQILKELSKLGPKKVVLTGVSFSKTTMGCGTYDKETDKTDFIYKEKVDGFYHGTGDVFSSILLAAMMNGLSLSESAAEAVTFTVDAINRSKALGIESRYGLCFEENLSEFFVKIKSKNK